MFQLSVHYLFEKTKLFEIEKFSFSSASGLRTVLSNHESLFTNILPDSIMVTMASKAPQHEDVVKIAVNSGGFLKIDNAQCEVWLL
jgi:F0F1-type ATP synthase epsilon subunit